MRLKLHKITKTVRMCNMNPYIEHTSQGCVKAASLADWALAHGVGALATDDVAHLLGIPTSQVPQRLAPLRKRHALFSPARGLWVPVPAEYREWGAPDPLVYIDDMMGFLGIDYCVGWLSAAAIHGASHHAAQVFQVATNRTVRGRAFGRSRLEFFSRGYVGSLAMAKERSATRGAKVATAGATMLMLADDQAECGGLDNVANLVVELSGEAPEYADDLMGCLGLFPDAAARRVGWLLDAFAGGAPEALAAYCSELGSATSFLSPDRGLTGRRDAKWDLVINEEVDLDL